MVDVETRNRELKGLLEASRVTGCDDLIIITYEEEGIIESAGKQVMIVPAWKWLLHFDGQTY